MKYNLPERVIRDISTFAKKHSVEKVILFGSRARGTNTMVETLILFTGILRRKYILF